MFKKMFGPKKIEGSGEPAAPEALRAALLKLFPKDGELNQYMRIEPHEQSPLGFKAVWEVFTFERRADLRFTQTASVDIRPQEQAVHLSVEQERHFMLPPPGQVRVEHAYAHMRVGRLEELKPQAEAYARYMQDKMGFPNEEAAQVTKDIIWDFQTSKKRMLEPLTACAAGMGWDVVY